MSVSAPLELHQEIIRPEWVDYNGHMNVAYYVLIFDHATDVFLDYLGLTSEFRSQNNASTFAGAMHVNYLGEVKEADKVRVTTQLLGYDTKRIHYFHHMYHVDEGYLAATSELLSLYMDMELRRVANMPEVIKQRLQEVYGIHSSLALPEQAGHVIAVKKQ